MARFHVRLQKLQPKGGRQLAEHIVEQGLLEGILQASTCPPDWSLRQIDNALRWLSITKVIEKGRRKLDITRPPWLGRFGEVGKDVFARLYDDVGAIEAQGDDARAVLLEAMQQLREAAAARACIVVFGKPNTTFTGRRQKIAFDSPPQHLLGLDMDAISAPEGMDPTSPTAVRWLIDNHLPEPFHQRTCIAQFSARAGLVGQIMKVHLYFLMEESFDVADAKEWAKSINTAGARQLIDDSLLQTQQPNYIAAPFFVDPTEDPFKDRDRIMLVPGKAGDTVPPGAIEARAVLAEARSRLLSTASPNQYMHLAHGSIDAALKGFAMGSVHRTALAVGMAWLTEGEPCTLPELAQRMCQAFIASGSARDPAELAREIDALQANIDGARERGFGLRRIRGAAKAIATGDSSPNAIWTIFIERVMRKRPDTYEQAVDGLPPRPGYLDRAMRRHFAQANQPAMRPMRGAREVPTIKDVPTDLHGVVCVRAGTGTGKTEHIALALADRSLCERIRFLYVSPRRSLVSDACARMHAQGFELHDYRIKGAVPQGVGLAVCLPSLRTQRVKEYLARGPCIVVIDEVCSTLDMLTGHITKDGHAERLRDIKDVLTNHTVYAMDAFCGTDEMTMLRRLGATDITAFDVLEGSKPMTGVTLVQRNLEDTEHEIDAALAAGKRVLVTTDSRRGINTWRVKHPHWFNEHALVIDGTTARGDQQRAFLSAPNTELEKYQLVIFSPAVDTGLSITRDVIALQVCIAGGALDAEGLFQMLRRYRPARQITFVHLRDAPPPRDFGTRLVGALQALHEAENADVFTHQSAARLQHQFFRARAKCLPDLVREQGGTVSVEITPTSREWRRIQKESRITMKQHEIDAVLTAQSLTTDEYEAMKRGNAPADTNALLRHECEYGTGHFGNKLTPQLVAWWIKHGPQQADRACALAHKFADKYDPFARLPRGGPLIQRPDVSKAVHLVTTALEMLGSRTLDQHRMDEVREAIEEQACDLSAGLLLPRAALPSGFCRGILALSGIELPYNRACKSWRVNATTAAEIGASLSGCDAWPWSLRIASQGVAPATATEIARRLAETGSSSFNSLPGITTRKHRFTLRQRLQRITGLKVTTTRVSLSAEPADPHATRPNRPRAPRPTPGLPRTRQGATRQQRPCERS